MGFLLSGSPPFGGYRGFVNSGGAGEYLRTVTGNPAVLAAALAKPLQGVTVYGASGGVGDATANLFRPSSAVVGGVDVSGVHVEAADGRVITARGKATSNVNRSLNSIAVAPNTSYTYRIFALDGTSRPALFIYDNAASSTIASASTAAVRTFTTGSAATTIAVGLNVNSGSTANYQFYIQLVEGEYTAATMPEYEPYGYKIPVLLGDKTINLYTPQQLTGNRQIADNFSVGDTVTIPWTDSSAATPVTYESEHDVVHKANDIVVSDDGGATEKTINGVYIQWHYATPYDIPFDVQEALYTAPAGGLAAGTYYFTVANLNTTFNGKTYMFTLNTALTEGMQLILSVNDSDFTQSIVRVYDDCYAQSKNTDYGTSGNISVSLWDETSGLPLSGDTSKNSTNGAGELNHLHRICYGYNRYSQSAIRQWLNSPEPARVANDTANYPGWWTPQNKWDRCPSQAFTKPGFLSGYSAEFIASMRRVKVVVAANTVTDGGITDVMYDKVFLPSLTEMNIAQQAAEGIIWDYYKQLFEDNPVEGRTNWTTNVAYPILKSYGINAKSTAVYVRLRSASRGYAFSAWGVSSTGKTFHASGSATSAYRQRPACVMEVSDALAVDIPAQTAMLTAGGVSTDVSAMQDWSQDFMLAKGDNTVSIGTNVQPSAVEWRYLSYSRGE